MYSILVLGLIFSFCLIKQQIPSKFVKDHKNKMDKSIWVLKTEDGTSWFMEIKREGAEYFFSRGDWEKFAKHHDLRFGDQIMVFLVGNSEFEVMLYSQTTCCRILPPQPGNTVNASSEDEEINGTSRNAEKCKRKKITWKYEAHKKSKGTGI